MMVVGLTGGIGSGKTLASDHFSSLGIDIIDTDIIARIVVQPGHTALAQLVADFGAGILQENGHLNRDALREIAFSSNQNKQRLDAITHPAIRQETLKQLDQVKSQYCIVVVPLLTANSAFSGFMNRIVAVSASTEIKIDRVQKRNNFTRDQVLSIMRTQLSDEQRERFADDIIVNNSSKENVFAQVEKLHKLYLELALQYQST